MEKDFNRKRLLDAEELANYVGICTKKAREWGRAIGAERRIGTRALYDRIAVDEAIDAQGRQQARETGEAGQHMEAAPVTATTARRIHGRASRKEDRHAAKHAGGPPRFPQQRKKSVARWEIDKMAAHRPERDTGYTFITLGTLRGYRGRICLRMRKNTLQKSAG